MCAIEDARALRRKRVYRESLKKMMDRAAEDRRALAALDAPEGQVLRARLRVQELAGEITRLSEEIFQLEEKLGLAHMH